MLWGVQQDGSYYSASKIRFFINQIGERLYAPIWGNRQKVAPPIAHNILPICYHLDAMLKFFFPFISSYDSTLDVSPLLFQISFFSHATLFQRLNRVFIPILHSYLREGVNQKMNIPQVKSFSTSNVENHFLNVFH